MGKGKVPNAYAVRRTVRSLRSQRYAAALRSMATKLPASGEQRQAPSRGPHRHTATMRPERVRAGSRTPLACSSPSRATTETILSRSIIRSRRILLKIEGDPKGLRIGLPRKFYFDDIDLETRSAVLGVADVLAKAGATIVEIDVTGAEDTHRHATTVIYCDICVVHAEDIDRRRDLISKPVFERMIKGRDRTGVDYAKALGFRETWRMTLRDVFARVDVALFPTSPYPAPPIVEGVHLEVATAHATRFTFGGGLAGNPGMSLPLRLHEFRPADRRLVRSGVVERGGAGPGRKGLAVDHRLAFETSAGLTVEELLSILFRMTRSPLTFGLFSGMLMPERNPSALASAFGKERKYFGVLYNNDEPDYRRSGSSGVSVSERSRRPGALVATSDPIELATEIMAAYVANNAVPRADLPALFEGLHAALKRLAEKGEVVLPNIVPPSPRCRSASPSRQII